MDSNQQTAQEDRIDLVKLTKKLWEERRLIVKWCIAAAVLGLVIAFSIPKEYTTTVKLAPEVTGNKSISGNLGALINMAGISSGNTGNVDAVYPDLYPDIVASIPFTVNLFDVKVYDQKDKTETTVYDYLAERTRSPWWNSVISAPFKLVGWVSSLFREKDESEKQESTDPFRLTRDEENIVKTLKKRIRVTVNPQNSVVTLSATMQDPTVSAMLIDTVMHNLQEYVTEYRTNKARNDLEFTQHLFDEAQADYYEAQARYAGYMDANQNVVLRSVRTEQERLQNEMMLAYNVYNQTAQQLQIAKAKVQESTPVYVVVQPATVPLSPSKPPKTLILIGCVFLAGVIASSWVLFGRGFIAMLRKKNT